MKPLNKIKCLMFLAMTTVMLPLFAQSVRHVVWNKVPISIELPIGHEKIITFPTSIRPFLPNELLNQGALKSINNDGVLYLIANKPFLNKMAEIKLSGAKGRVILLDLSASKTASPDQIEVLLAKPDKKVSKQPAGPQEEDKSLGDMIRWVSQQLYAPKRLLTKPSWIQRSPMKTQRFVALYRGAVVSAMPLASWKSNDYYITAVLLRNSRKDRKVKIRHSLIRGNWIAMSFFRLGPLSPEILTKARTTTDSTIATLVSSVPFVDALKEGVSGV